MKDLLHKASELTRRDFASRAARSLLGVGLLPAAFQQKGFAQETSPFPGRYTTARKVIYLYMSGGMTHIDTFDPKPDHENGGTTAAIDTNVDGIRYAEHLPTLATHADKLAVVRSMHSTRVPTRRATTSCIHPTPGAERSSTRVSVPGLSKWMGNTTRSFRGQSESVEAPAAAVLDGWNRNTHRSFSGAPKMA